MTMLWSAKEALSKAIKIGFTILMDVFEVISISKILILLR
jgi:phosphopantetheinyl transferase (holo-ACP synthase)